MRWIRVMVFGAFALGVASLDGCGGKVVVDAEGPVGGGGVGGSATGGMGGAGGASSSSSGGNTCELNTCSGTPDGTCDCSGTCSGTEVKATCFSTGGSFSCACTVAGTVAAKCEGPAGTDACDLKAGCCAQYFP
ncbi:MAG TPA: hypothetical protein PK156_30240 [Polyangium sp.]|nr:hypothetical protein [Polyangium sp.]